MLASANVVQLSRHSNKKHADVSPYREHHSAALPSVYDVQSTEGDKRIDKKMNDVANSPEPKSLASELQVVRQAFPNSLFDDYGWQRLVRRAASVPASMIGSTFGFELRLGKRERAADFCVTLKAGSDKASEFLSFPPVVGGGGTMP